MTVSQHIRGYLQLFESAYRLIVTNIWTNSTVAHNFVGETKWHNNRTKWSVLSLRFNQLNITFQINIEIL